MNIQNFSLPLVEAIVIEYASGRADDCALITDLLDPTEKEIKPDGQRLYLTFKAARGTGAKYIRETFNIEPTVSRIPRPATKFRR